MSYSAYIICNCYNKGKTSEPPYKEYLCFEEDEIFIEIPEELWKEDEDKIYRMYEEFDNWKRQACEHEDMKLADEYLSNISGMESFRQIIKELGGKAKYPILTAFLPISNDGILPAEFAEKALDELLLLEKELKIERKVELTEKSNGSLIASVSAETYWLFVFTENNKNTLGIDKDGFFILENIKDEREEFSYIMFRSINFVQKTISKNWYKYIDLQNGNSYECSVGILPNDEEAIDNYQFVVKTKHVKIRDGYGYMIEPLKRLARASIASGKPIHWS